MAISVDVQDTPNPRSKRFVLDRSIQEEPRGRAYSSGDEPDDQLVAALLGVEGVESVLTLPSSLTVTCGATTDWDEVIDLVTKAIRKALG